MRRLVLIVFVLMCLAAKADVRLIKIADDEPISLKDEAGPIIQTLNAAPNQDPIFDVGLGLIVDESKFYVKPSMFMMKSASNEVCTPTSQVLAYQCKEGQRFVKGCHLLFFDNQGRSAGLHTMNILENLPHYCNSMSAMGVGNSAKNELLVTMQYFLADGGGARRASELGSGWFRMTTLIRVKANNGKIEVEQDDSCLGNPNRIDTIAKARRQLQRCASIRQ